MQAHKQGGLIRRMTVDDLELVLEWRNHPYVRKFMYTQHQIGIDEHRRWFEKASVDVRKHLLIFEKNCVPLGFVNFTQTSSSMVVDWGFYASPDAPRGTGYLMGTSALDYAFKSVGVHKVSGQVICFNQGSLKFHKRLGFTQEGVLREQFYDGQQYHDVICFGLLADEWRLNN